jgi:hypothetical protein
MKAIALFLILYLLIAVSLNAESTSHESTYFQNYQYNEFGLRKIDPLLNNQNAHLFIVLAGDSNVFGDGLPDDKTLPVLLSKLKRNYNVYNFGLRGGGPHDSLYFFKEHDFKKIVKEDNGIYIYNFYPFLFERVIGSKNYLKWCKRNSPYYYLEDHDQLKYGGNFNDRFFITSFYQFINRHKWLDYFIPKLPQIHRWHIKLTAVIFHEMQSQFIKLYPKGKFLVVVNNSYSDNPMYIWQNKQLEIYLKELKVDYRVVPIVNDFQKKYLFNDGHINEAGQVIESQAISSFIN